MTLVERSDGTTCGVKARSAALTGALARTLVAVSATALAGCCFGSAETQQQMAWESKMRSLDDLASRAEDPETKTEIETLEADLEEKYAALPSLEDGKDKRGEAFGKLHQEAQPLIDALEKKVQDAESAAQAEEDRASREKKDEIVRRIAGRWVGGGIDLTIDHGGSVEYKKTSGATEKSVSGPISTITEKQFVVKVLAFESTFKIDEMPEEVDGEWKMTIDGTELTRVEAP